MPSNERRGISARGRSVVQLALFSIAVIGMLLFSYLNIYSLPLGTASIAGVLENAESLYGIELSIYGTIEQAPSSEFHILNGSSSACLSAIWLGEGDLPINGTTIIAYGQLAEGPDGPVLICDSIAPERGQPMVFENPWALPALRLFTIALLWFLTSVFITAIMSVVYLLRPNVLIGNRMRAMIEISILSGSVLFAIFLILSFSESSLAMMPSVPTFCLIASFILLSLSPVIRYLRKTEPSELADSLPILSGILAGISILAVFVQEQLRSEDLIGSLLVNYLPESLIAILIGTIGLIAIGTYLNSRKYEQIGSSALLGLVKIEVK